MLTRSKARYSTAMGRLFTGCLENGMRASTAVVPPPPRVSGEQVSVHQSPSMKHTSVWVRAGELGGASAALCL